MRILHINTHDRGGAANAAIRLHYGLLEKNIDSNILFLKNSSRKVKQGFYYEEKKKFQELSLKEKVFLKLNLKKFPQDIDSINRKRLADKPIGYEGYSFPESNYNIANHPLVAKADIIHLHWVSRFLDYPSFFSQVSKPIVWTLHDMNPFLGGFHYANDEEDFKHTFAYLEKDLVKIKKQAISERSNLHIVSLSNYIREKSLKSDVLNRYPHYHIINGLNTNIFRPYDQSLCKKIFGIPEGNTVFLFVSENLENKRKGFDILLNAIQNLNCPNVTFCAIGERANKDEEQGILYLGSMVDEKLLALAYSAADAFVLPSREDNLPNTMLESLACGTPVIAFPRGGMADVIETGINGILLSDVQPQLLHNAIQDVIDKKYHFNRKKIRNLAVQKFAQEVQSKEYISLYKTINNF